MAKITSATARKSLTSRREPYEIFTGENHERRASLCHQCRCIRAGCDSRSSRTVAGKQTDLDPKELAEGLTREEFLAKLVPTGGASRSKGATGLIGLFVRPNW